MQQQVKRMTLKRKKGEKVFIFSLEDSFEGKIKKDVGPVFSRQAEVAVI